ncbi:ankyrin repeat-containing domain protein [Fusarium flagelliforme]|uniref:ankyrin repeat-containing domain protein n=1 Tax=Fusarium flagelliforme TaxID=2675880 RepID=UPI001E8E4BD4|nr:ankyrin repeat-containing domain protein [Fusarium flagelliforme]KAH7183538.1 ankyrin repeat-containing domain protein [Fusarium flagelliforme]
MLECLIAAFHEAIINQAEHQTGELLLHKATFHGHEDIARMLLGIPGIEPDQPHSDIRTALALAYRYGLEEIAQALLDDARVDLSSTDWHRSMPLLAAIKNNHVETAEILLASPKVITDDKDGFGKNFRGWADKLGYSEILFLLESYFGKEDTYNDGIEPRVNMNMTRFDGRWHTVMPV